MAPNSNVKWLAPNAPLPFDCNGCSPWGLQDALPRGEYEMRLNRFGMSQNEEGTRSVVVECDVVHGPDDTDDKAGALFNRWFTMKNQGNKNFFYGFLQQLCPAGLVQKNLLNGAKGAAVPNQLWWQGTQFRCVLEDETYTDNDGKQRTRSKMQNRVEVTNPSAFAMQNEGAQAQPRQQRGNNNPQQVVDTDDDFMIGQPAD